MTQSNNEGALVELKQKLKEPERPEIHVSSKRNPKSYKIICKLVLRKFGYCILKSLGNASESVVQLAESLSRNEIAVIEKIESGVAQLEDGNNETGTRSGITFEVRLAKGKRFDEFTKDLE